MEVLHFATSGGKGVKIPRPSHVKQALKGVHGQDKKHGGERVSLADSSGMVEGGTPLSIEQCAGGGCAEQDGNPVAPTRSKPQSLKDF